MSVLETIMLSSAGFSALFSGAIIWLFKSWISERLKNAIAHEYAQKLETHKAQLQADMVKHSRVFDDQATAIANIYEKLLKVSTSSKQLLNEIETGDYEKIKAAWIDYNDKKKEFGEYYYPKAIFLQTSTADKISQFIFKLEGMYQLTEDRKSVTFDIANNPAIKQDLEQVGIDTSLMEKNTAEIITAIREDFQGLLGLKPK